MTSSHKHGSLPRLSTSKEPSRRDSLSSSRTRDSGYNSDLDVSCSPLDYLDSDQRMFSNSYSSYVAELIAYTVLGPLAPASDPIFVGKPSFLKAFRALQEPSPSQRVCITSDPASAHPSFDDQLRPTKFICPFKSTSSASNLTAALPGSGIPAQNDNIEQWIKDNLPSRDRPKERVSSIVSLSSATSCEMYTNTDVSEDEDEREHGTRDILPALPRSALKTIDLIMRKIEVNLSSVAYNQRNGGATSNASSNTASVSHQSSRKASQGSSKRKSRLEDHQPPNDDEEDGSNKRRRGSMATVESSETGAKFACPFFKNEPNRYRARRTCPGPGWPTVHRMKEHLYRAHAQSIYCPRCYNMFDADIDLSNHLRSAHCHVSAPQPIEGIDRETLKALRKRSPALRLEEDKWRDVYHLLFPEVAMEDIPSPCK